MPPLWQVMIYTKKPHDYVHALGWLGDTAPTPSGGGGGHEAVNLPKRRPVVVWRRADLWTMTLKVTFDNFADGDAAPVQDAVAALTRMWRPLDDEEEPPAVKLDARGDVVPLQHLTWRITNVEWGEGAANSSGNRTRQTATVTLLEDNPDERLAQVKSPPSKRRRKKSRKGSKSKAKVYVVRSGDVSLSTIAARLDIDGGWRKLAELQKPPIHDPRSIKPGQHLRLP